LLIQGSTLPWLAKKLLPPGDEAHRSSVERARLAASLRAAGIEVLEQHGLDTAAPFPDLVTGPIPPLGSESLGRQRTEVQVQLEMIEAQRKVLLAAIEEGKYSSEITNTAMAFLDADQIALELKVAPAGGH
jgi:CPA1 family monovalent cation:H+ antiporter